MAVRVAHTAQLSTAELDEIRRLLDAAFGERFGDDDWEHALGGLHLLVAGPAGVLAHAAVVQRRVLYAGRPVRTGYVEAVAVAPDHRGRGHAGAVMAEAERIIAAAYDLGALSASAGVEGLYLARGWLRWRGETGVITASGLIRTPDDDDSTYVRAVSTPEELDLTGLLACDWRGGDPW